jgi:hypothetical protein
MVRSQLRLALVALLAFGCAGESSPAGDEAQDASVGEVKTKKKAPKTKKKTGKGKGKAEAETAKAKVSFGSKVRGLRLNRSIVVRATPDLDGEKLGTVAAHTVVGWQQAVEGAGCDQRWIEIVPRGWVCEGYLEPVGDRPGGVELPKLRAGERVPGTYGKVFGEDALLTTIEDGAVVSETPIVGSSTVRKRGSAVVDDVEYWKIDGGKFVAVQFLRPHDPSSFQGERLFDGRRADKPMAFAISSNRPGDWVVVRDAPGGKRVRRLAPRTLVSLEGDKKNSDGSIAGYFLSDDEFIAAADLRHVHIQEPPPLTEPNERWFDVDLDSQILVAYEGAAPVYATLISSGTRKNPTETGIFRIWIKFSETSMSGRMGESDAYSVATVPWTQFYENDFALHTSYWHDHFGQQRSHGCVNLSPRDSRFLYFWSEPQVPIGWSMANASSERPGSMVRVHSKNDPEPEFKGAALKVQRARLAAAANP